MAAGCGNEPATVCSISRPAPHDDESTGNSHYKRSLFIYYVKSYSRYKNKKLKRHNTIGLYNTIHNITSQNTKYNTIQLADDKHGYKTYVS